MKVVLINSFFGGSTGKIARGIAKKYIENNNECVFIYGRGKKTDSQIPSFCFSNKINCVIDGIVSRIFDNQGLNSVIATKRLVRFLKKYNPDLIHLHNIHGYYLNYKILFKYIKESNVKIEWTLHDCWAFTGHCAYFTFCNCDKWQTVCQNCPQKKTYPISYVFDRSRKNFLLKKEIFTSIDSDKLTLISPSQWLADLTRKSFLNKFPVKVIKNDINLSLFKNYQDDEFRIKNGFVDKKIILGVSFVWDTRKGLKYFIELDKNIDHNKIVIFLVGVDSKLKKYLDNNTKIKSILRTDNQLELAKIYSTSDLFFNPTLEDNYPTVNLEAQASGTMVFSFDTGGCRETDLNKGLFEIVDTSNYIEKINKFLLG